MIAVQRTLRIGFVIDRWQPSRGGAEQALAKLARHLATRGHEVIAFTERASADAPGRVQLVPRSWSITRASRERTFAARATAATEERDCDVVVGTRHLARVDLYWPHGGSHARSLAAKRAAEAWSPEGAVPIEPAQLGGRHRAFVEFERDLLERGGARRIVCVSELVERELATDFPACRERLVRIENGVDLARFRPQNSVGARIGLRRGLGLSESSVLIAFCAREPTTKGLPVLLAALARLAREPWTLVVAGPRDVAKWRKRARSAGLATDRVRVLSDVDTAELFAAADVCAHPTWRDTSGLVVLEALASGVPTITTRAAGEAAAVHETCGSVIERPGDIDALTAALALWIDRVRARSIDRDVIHASVVHRDESTGLARLEHEIESLAATGQQR
ncbi:MAG: glycosyltransferase family 4 protein [Planctomycetota bacterium]|nr:glycosyltransferase family 4 protein [Planctomycetota bacterium]